MRVFAKDMEGFVAVCRREVTAAYESYDYTHCVEVLVKENQVRHQALVDDLKRRAQELGFAVVNSQGTPTPVPLPEGRPMTQDEYGQVSQLI